jgi:hypothetical protein
VTVRFRGEFHVYGGETAIRAFSAQQARLKACKRHREELGLAGSAFIEVVTVCEEEVTAPIIQLPLRTETPADQRPLIQWGLF